MSEDMGASVPDRVLSPAATEPSCTVSAHSGDAPSRWGWWAGRTEEYMNIGGPFFTREDAIEAGRNDDPGEPFWICKARTACWSLPSADAVLDHMVENSGELFFDDGFTDFVGGQDAENAAKEDLQRVLNEWFQRHVNIFPEPTAFDGVSNSELIDCDSDRSGEAGETVKLGSTEGESAGPKDIAQKDTPHD